LEALDGRVHRVVGEAEVIGVDDQPSVLSDDISFQTGSPFLRRRSSLIFRSIMYS
jgi:hypothetical protein